MLTKTGWQNLKFPFFGICTCLLIMGLAGCPSQQPSPPTQTQKVLSYAIATDITSLDPVRVTEDSPRLISAQVMETLVGYNENLKLLPVLAESWQPAKGGQEWRFKLRENVSFQNDPCFGGKSRTVKATDVVYSLQRMLDPKTQTLGAFILSDVVEGATAFMEGKAPTVSGIIAEDEKTVLIKLTKPFAQFPARLSLPFAAIIPKEAVDFYKDKWATHPVGTGAFKFKSWDVASGQIVLERNPNYWQQISTNLSQVNFSIVKSEATQLADFVQGKIDAFEVTPAVVNQVMDSSGQPVQRFADAQIIRQSSMKVHFVGLDFQTDVVKDKNFRLAVNYAIDKEKLTKQVLNGLAKPANGVLVPSLPGYDNQPIYPQDVKKAQQLIKASPYKGQQLTYVTDNSTSSVAVAEFIQSQLAAIGVKTRIDKNPESVWVDKLVKGQFDLGKLYFAFDYPSPENGFSQFLKSNFSPAGNNFGHYSNPKFDELYAQALKETDPAKAESIFKQLNQIIRDDAPWIFLYSPERIIVLRKGIEGLKINPLSFSLLLSEVQKQ